jgi:hypothetical protein
MQKKLAAKTRPGVKKHLWAGMTARNGYIVHAGGKGKNFSRKTLHKIPCGIWPGQAVRAPGTWCKKAL